MSVHELRQDYARWHELNRRRATAFREGLCTCCAFIIRAGDPGARPVRAVAEWTTQVGSRELLCASCLGRWQDNAADDESLIPLALEPLPWQEKEN